MNGAPGRAAVIQQMDVDGHGLRVGIWPGTAPQPPLLLFNGVGGNLELLAPFIDELRDVEVIGFDIPGVGGSGVRRRPYRLRTMASLASKLARLLGHGVVDALGVSWGGALAQEFAFRQQRRCRRLVLCATAAGVPAMVPGSPRVLAKLLSPRRYHEKAFLKEAAGELYGGRFRSDPELVQSHASRVRWPSTLGYSLQLLATLGWTSLPWLWRLRQPTLVICGADDPICPPINGKILARCIPDSRLELIDDGHLFLIAKAEESARIVRRFLA